jgi:peptide/nickel transport system permease protein
MNRYHWIWKVLAVALWGLALVNLGIVGIIIASVLLLVVLGLLTDPKRVKKDRAIGMWFGIAWLAIVLVLSIFGDALPFISGENERVAKSNYVNGPGREFWFGSDDLGKDMFSRCIYSARLALTVSIVSITGALLIGGTLGMLAGYFKGWIDRVVSILVDSLLAFPAIVIAALVIGRFDVLQQSDIQVLGFGFEWLTRRWSVTIIFLMLSIAPVARIVRAQTLSLSEREYVLAAKSLGARTPRILVREILPNLVPAMVSVIFTGVAILLAAEGGLAFIGYSVKAPDSSWGLMINIHRSRIQEAWWATVFPALMLFFTVLAFNLVGDRVAKRFDIKEAAL